jgi:hypothetical protein
MSKIGVYTHVGPWEIPVIADLDTLLIALYVELTDRIIPAHPRGGGPGRPPVVTDAELVCLAVAQVLLRYDDERHWLRSAPARVGHLFPRLLRQSEYNLRLRLVAGLMEHALRWLAACCPCTADRIRLMDATPVRAAGPPGRPPTARTWPAGPDTGTTPPTTASTGAPSSCSSPPPTG